MSNNRPHIKLLKSKSTIMDGQVEQPRPPEADDLQYGEIAMNYKSGMETLYIKNDENNIVEFKSYEHSEGELDEIRETITDNELVISSSLNDLNERIINEKAERVNTDMEIIQNLGNEITNRVSSENVLRNDLTSLINNLSSQIPIPDGETIITDDNGKLKVKTHEGFIIDSNGINVAVGNSLTTESGDIEVKPGNETIIVDPNGVYVNVNDEGGIGYDSNGLYVKTGDGLTLDTDSVKVNTPSNSGLTVDSNGVAVEAGEGLTVDNTGVKLKTASTSEIGGVAIHDVHKTLIYEYRPIIGYTDDEDEVVVISVEEYNALPQEEKGLYWEVYGECGEITEEQYNELPEEDKINPAKVRITTDELTFNDGDGNFGVNINDADNKAYVNVPIAGENNGKYGLVKVGVTDVVHGLNGIKINRNDRTLAVDYDETYFSLNNGGVSLTFNADISSLLKSMKSFYDVIIAIEVVTFNTSTGEIIVDTSDTVPVRKFTVYYNPDKLTNAQIINGAVNGTVNVKVITTFSGVSSSFITKFPKIWESFFVLTDASNGEFCIFNPYCKSIDSTKNEPYIKITQLSVSQNDKIDWQKIELINHTDWVNIY